MNEKIAAAALRIGNEVYTGTTHFAAMRAVIELPGVESSTIARMLMDAEDGFVTDTGRFVTRSEAFDIAREQGQINHAELSDPEANKEFYQSDEPSLDSGLIGENYAPFRQRPSFMH